MLLKIQQRFTLVLAQFFGILESVHHGRSLPKTIIHQFDSRCDLVNLLGVRCVQGRVVLVHIHLIRVDDEYFPVIGGHRTILVIP